MTKDLPPSFDEFSKEAKIDFLKEARGIHDLMSYLFELIDEDYEHDHDRGAIQTEDLVRLYVQLLEEGTAQD